MAAEREQMTPDERLCSIPECGRPLRARGLCTTHWARWRKHGDPLVGADERVPWTDEEVERLGHLIRSGLGTSALAEQLGRSVSSVRKKAIRDGIVSPRQWDDAEKRQYIEDRRVVVDGCWIWQGHKTAEGYGQARWHGRVFAHRLAYEAFVGPIPEGLTIDHLCRNPSCVNPEHMEPVTIQENLARGVSPSAENARKTHCKRGHPFDAENTYVEADGHRACRACKRLNDRKRRGR